jgi:hypothetical protein
LKNILFSKLCYSSILVYLLKLWGEYRSELQIIGRTTGVIGRKVPEILGKLHRRLVKVYVSRYLGIIAKIDYGSVCFRKI